MGDPGQVLLPGSERLLDDSQVLGPADPSQPLELTVLLRSGSDLALWSAATALGGQYPLDRNYADHEGLARAAGADAAALPAIARFATDHGIRVTEADALTRRVVLAGTTGAVAEAFGVALVRARGEGGEHRGRRGPIFLPSNLAPFVEGIFGLDDRRQARPHGQLSAGDGRPDSPPLSAVEIANAYRFPGDTDGQGQCIGLLEFGGGYLRADLEAYFAQRALPVPSIAEVSIHGQRNAPGSGDLAYDVEVTLDLEVVGAVAPAASYVLYYAPFTERGWIDALSAVVHDRVNCPSILSISWGYTEGLERWSAQAVGAIERLLAEAAMRGITVVASSGDDGSADHLDDGFAHVEMPAASPFALACGGTSLRRAGGEWVESVWNNGPGSASGGGLSEVHPLPGWQSGLIPVPLGRNRLGGRGVPDVAAHADKRYGYAIHFGGEDCAAGGTSAAAPLWAGLIARINQRLGTRVGYFNPLLYGTLAGQGGLRDIVDGHNDPSGKVGGYAASTGWDPCTGWGSPIGDRLLEVLGRRSTGGAR